MAKIRPSAVSEQRPKESLIKPQRPPCIPVYPVVYAFRRTLNRSFPIADFIFTGHCPLPTGH
jgi:hypothetical protein